MAGDPPRPRVKICGITNLEDALGAAEAGADALGFIFYPKSPRYVKEEKVASIVARLPPFVTPVGVFVNRPPDEVSGMLVRTGLRCAQLHGDETPEHCTEVDGPVIRVARVDKDFNAASLIPYAEAGVETFMLDTAKQGLYGGTGETFDWSSAIKVKPMGRVVLSGGVDPGNVVDAVRTVRPYAVDTGSGVESEPGKKDLEKVIDFIRAVRKVE